MILQNAAHCKECDTYIISLHTHDFRGCPCGNCAVDGGKDYTKRTFKDINLIEDFSIKDTSTPEEIRARLLWGTRGKGGTEPLRFLPIGQLTTEHLEAILRTQTQINELYRNAIVTELRIRKIADV